MFTLRNSLYEINVDPKRGGAITSVRSKKTNDEWIYFDEERRPFDSSLENYDDVWCGGFEELFPNDAVAEIKGRLLKDHGELWQNTWNVDTQKKDSVTMNLQCTTVPAKVTKEVSLNEKDSQISLRYTLQNTGNESFPYLFKLHPAMRIESGDEILLPNGTVIPVDLSFSRIIGSAGPFQWPLVLDAQSGKKNISVIPERSLQLQEFIYVKEMSQGWCGLQRKKTGEKFILRYSLADFPYCWFFMALGGWKDHYTVVLEPCTNFPKDMESAIANGTCAIMGPGEKREFSVTLSIES